MQAPELFEGLTKKGELTGKDERLLVYFAENKPLGIFSVFQQEHQRIYELAKKFGRKPVIINGSVPAVKRAEADEGFRKGVYDTMIASPATAGIGYNWEHCDHCIFTSLDYLDDTFLQARRRFSRGTRTTPLLVTVLEYEDSIDQMIFGILLRKSRDANKVDPTREVINLFRDKGAAKEEADKAILNEVNEPLSVRKAA